MGCAILNIRTASNNKDFKRIAFELEHLISIKDLLTGGSSYKDYMDNSRQKYLDQMNEYQENPYENLWNELQDIAENQGILILILDEIDKVFLDVITTGVNNISNFMSDKDFDNIYIEAYHIHNIPSIVISKRKKEMIEYYLKVECKQYLREGEKSAKKNFESVWKELIHIAKPKKKFIFF